MFLLVTSSTMSRASGEAVELRHHQDVPGPAGGEGLVRSDSFAITAGKSVVDIDQTVRHAERLWPACW